MESIIKDKIVEHLSTNNLISKDQHGFVKGKSCTTNLLESFDLITKATDNGIPVDIIFKDFSKAFDRVPHTRLCLRKLIAYGIVNNMLNWIINYLKDRKQRVILGDAISDWLHVFSGVPQGSVLGPLLFVIFINDLASQIKNNPKLFADDTKMIGIIKDKNDSISMQNDINLISKWCETWQMSLNESKCKVIHIGKSNQKFNYHINGHQVLKVEFEKDLGVIISSDLKWDRQIHSVIATSNRILDQLKNSFK
jgi:hypothetical protein